VVYEVYGDAVGGYPTGTPIAGSPMVLDASSGCSGVNVRASSVFNGAPHHQHHAWSVVGVLVCRLSLTPTPWAHGDEGV